MADTPKGFSDPATRAFAITPDDNADLAIRARGFFVGVGGNVKATLWDDTAGVVFKGCLVGQYYPFAIKKVFATGTAATDIVGVY